MKNLILILLGLFLFGFTLINPEKEVILGQNFNIHINDSTNIKINQVINKTTNLPVYYYSDLYVHACNTGECKMIDLRMFWDIYGNYFKYQIKKASPLTKYNHKKFKAKEYTKLHLLLCDTSSKFRNITFGHLTEKQADKKIKTDARSGATIKLFSSDNIKGAVKTSHTLWHIANGEVKSRINKAKLKYLSSHTNLLPIIKIDIKTTKSVNKILESFDKLSLTQIAYLIQNIKKQNIKTETLTTDSRNIFETKESDKKLLFSNYFFRSKTHSKKASKFLKTYSFIIE